MVLYVTIDVGVKKNDEISFKKGEKRLRFRRMKKLPLPPLTGETNFESRGNNDSKKRSKK